MTIIKKNTLIQPLKTTPTHKSLIRSKSTDQLVTRPSKKNDRNLINEDSFKNINISKSKSMKSLKNKNSKKVNNA
jgi:hypothetical protein